MRDVLLEQRLRLDEIPVYDREPGAVFVIKDRTAPMQEPDPAPAYVVKDHAVFEDRVSPHRVHVPLIPVADLKKSADDLVFELVRHVAELGNWVDYESDFYDIWAYFASRDLPLETLVKHPALTVELPPGLDVIERDDMARDRFYCLTRPDYFGRRPVRIDGIGFLIFNPKGLLTVFV